MSETSQPESKPVSIEQFYAVQMHYTREFHYLQTRKYREWLSEMVSPDIHYWMPPNEQLFARERARTPEASPDDPAVYNENYNQLRDRVEHLYTGLVWIEDPPSMIRYFMSNLQVNEGEHPDELRTRCNLLVIRHRRQHEITQHCLEREDLLRREGNGFKVVRRKLMLDARVVVDANLFFFC